jgi:hypothetical protein
VTIEERIWLMVWARALTALFRTTRSALMASTIPLRLFGIPLAWPERTAVAAA